MCGNDAKSPGYSFVECAEVSVFLFPTAPSLLFPRDYGRKATADSWVSMFHVCLKADKSKCRQVIIAA